jgi:teichuronic acid biosynthesis glycosyltransferase TuaC
MNKSIFWLHTFNPKIENGGVFMYQLIDEANKKGDVVIPYYIGGSIKEYFISYIRLWKRIMKNDIVHAQYGSFCGLFTSLLPGKKILSIRGSDWYIAPQKRLKDKIHNQIAHFLTLMSLSRFDKIIVMSNHMKTEIEGKTKLKNIIVIPDGINLKKFFPISKIEARTLLGEPNNNNIWVLFSTLTKDNCSKRAWLAEEAIKVLSTEMKNIELKIMNGISHDKVNLFINSCDVILLTSTHEGYPNIIKEGLACNVPFVSTDVSDLKIIAEKESNCIIVEPNVADIVSAIKKVTVDSSTPNLREHVQIMDMSKVCESILSIY